MSESKIPINTKDIATTIMEEGFIIGKNNAVNISLDCDALEIYKERKPLEVIGMRIKREPIDVGTLYFRKNGEFSESWYFDNNRIGEPIKRLSKKLENKYGIQVVLNDEYYVVWGKDDIGI